MDKSTIITLSFLLIALALAITAIVMNILGVTF